MEKSQTKQQQLFDDDSREKKTTDNQDFYKFDFGRCRDCNQPLTFVSWCCACKSAQFKSAFPTWTSEAKGVDRYIRFTQLNATSPGDVLEWFQFSSFDEAKIISWTSEGGNIFSAKLKENGKKFVLKFVGKGDKHDALLRDDLKRYHDFSKRSDIDLRCYGMTRDSVTDDYLIVLDYEHYFALKQLIKKRLRTTNRSHRELLELDPSYVVEHKANAKEFDLGYGKCPKCDNSLSSTWCRTCKAKDYQAKFSQWTSGNNQIDEFIRFTQMTAKTPDRVLEWFQYNKFENIQKIGEGGSGNAYSAKLKDHNKKLVLKSIGRGGNVVDDILTKLKVIYDCKKLGRRTLSCYGLTQNPNTDDYLLVLEYAVYGNLHHYVRQKRLASISWRERFQILHKIAEDLAVIHQAGLVHHDLHTGNILRVTKDAVQIADVGLGQAAVASDNQAYGTMPHVAPEVPRGQPYTYASDIYSLGMIMWELTSDASSSAEESHDLLHLASKICEGLRPAAAKGTPKIYSTLMLKCLSKDPQRRPTADAVSQELAFFKDPERHSDPRKEQARRQFQEAEKFRLTNSTKGKASSKASSHPSTIFKNRLLRSEKVGVDKI